MLCTIIGFVVALLVQLSSGDELFFDHDLEYYPESHHSFELDFLDVESHSHIPDHDPPGYQEADSEQESPLEHARNAWQQHLGDEVRGGYTVQDLDGTLTHYSYSKIRPQVDGDSYY